MTAAGKSVNHPSTVHSVDAFYTAEKTTMTLGGIWFIVVSAAGKAYYTLATNLI
jgi:hypothetical protein